MKKIIILTGLFLLAFIIQTAAQTKSKVFRGYVSDKRVQMTLTREGGKVTGTYFYQKIGKNLQLNGSIDAKGNLKLTERDAKGVKTGEFSGQWKENESGNIRLEGDWINPKSKENLSFYLTEEVVEFTGGAKFTSKTFAEANKPKMFEITAEYPVLSGVNSQTAAKFNRLVSTKVMEWVNDFRKDMLAMTAEDLKFAKERGIRNYLDISYVAELANDDLISIAFGVSAYTGGVHPNYYSFPVNFDLRNAKEIKLADLFKANSNYLKAISDYSIKKLKIKTGDMSDEEWIATGAGPNADNFKSWNITKKGILINFDPYQVAAYAAGPQEVLIPLSELKNLLRENHPLSNL